MPSLARARRSAWPTQPDSECIGVELSAPCPGQMTGEPTWLTRMMVDDEAEGYPDVLRYLTPEDSRWNSPYET